MPKNCPHHYHCHLLQRSPEEYTHLGLQHYSSQLATRLFFLRILFLALAHFFPKKVIYTVRPNVCHQLQTTLKSSWMLSCHTLLFAPSLSAMYSDWPVQEFLSFVVCMDRGETLYARCNVRQERRLCDVIQTLKLSNKDSGKKETLLSAMYNHCTDAYIF